LSLNEVAQTMAEKIQYAGFPLADWIIELGMPYLMVVNCAAYLITSTGIYLKSGSAGLHNMS
jgi:hypothetical protein